MQVRVSGKRMEIAGALPQRVRLQVQSAIERYFDGGAHVSVVFSREGTFLRADCMVHLDSGIVLKAAGDGSDAYRAFDEALQRMEKRVRRYMRRLKGHHDRGRSPRGALF
jgi:ribosomal subunit interface protein